MPTPNSHALLSASSAHRWLACTAAPHFEENFPNGTSPYAEEGTLAHSICELCARKKFTVMSTRKFNAELKKLQAQPHYSDEMLKTAEAYVEYLTEKAMSFPSTPHVVMETRVDLTDYISDGYGTCDNIMIGGDLLHITDYKHGKGVAVSAEGNPQMRLYALGALKLYRAVYGDQIRRVSMGICQPRLSDTASEDTLTVEELLAWGESIKPAAQEAYNGPGVFCPGEHCRFCKGKAQCRARADQMMGLDEFKDFVPENKVALEVRSLPNEAKKILGVSPTLSDIEIGDLLVRGQNLVQWFNDLQAYALEALMGGKEIPGFKVVAGRSNRAFKDTDAAIQTLIDSGIDKAMLFDYKPKTLTELEKLVGKKAFGELLADQIVRPVGKPTLAPMSDERKAYNAGAAEFAGAADG